MTWRIQNNGTYSLRIGDTTTTAPPHPLGTIVRAADSYWGSGEFILLKAAGSITNGHVVAWDSLHAAVSCPTTGNTARPVGVAINALSSGDYFWAQISGQNYVKAGASVAAGSPVGMTGAGSIGASGAGIEVQGMISVIASAGTVTGTCVTTNGSPTLKFPNGARGFFVGAALSGTGISGTVTAISYDEKTVTASANASATGQITATGTFTGYNICSLNRPSFQGRIT